MSWPSVSQPSAERSTGSGCRPWVTCGSCCGSPSSSRLRAAVDTATVSASGELPGLVDHEQVERPAGSRPGVREVPRGAADDVTRRAARRRSRRSGPCAIQRHGASSSGSSPRPRLLADRGRRSTPAPATSRSMFSTTAWDCATTPTRHPRRDERGDHAGAGVRLAGARRALDREVGAVEVGGGRGDRGDVRPGPAGGRARRCGCAAADGAAGRAPAGRASARRRRRRAPRRPASASRRIAAAMPVGVAAAARGSSAIGSASCPPARRRPAPRRRTHVARRRALPASATSGRGQHGDLVGPAAQAPRRSWTTTPSGTGGS